MDGSYKSMEREEIVRKFQNDSKYKAFLLTTGVGSVGLTLTAATNVIIFDPDWNPGKDDQEMVRNFYNNFSRNWLKWCFFTNYSR